MAGALKHMQGRFPDGVSQYNSAIWTGLELRVQRQQFDFNETEEIGLEDGTTKTIKKYRYRNMPTEFVGIVGAATKGKAVAEVAAPVKTAPAKTAQAEVAAVTPSPAASGGPSGGPIAEFVAGLSVPFKLVYGKKAADLDTESFMMWALERPEVISNDAVMNAAMNDGELQKALVA